MDDTLRTLLLLLHEFASVGLIGAITHQALVAPRKPKPLSFTGRYRAVDPFPYRNAVVCLFVATTLLGALLYPDYRSLVKPVLEAADLRRANGSFEVKEHLASIGLFVLPAYWSAWTRGADPQNAFLRNALTWLLCAIVWWNFTVGHILNNLQGLSR